MKSFLRNVVNRKEASGAGLLGRTVKIGAYTVRVEAHLADGGFASIYRVRDGSTGTAYALKHMRLMGDYEAIADCMTEVNTLKKLRDVPSVVTLRAAAFTGAKGNEQEAYLLLDLCKDNLVSFMSEQDNKLSTAKILQVFSAVCQAVAAMHRQTPPLSHSVSNKPAVYESSDAVLMGEEVIRKYTTPAYRAPEMWDLYSRERIDTKADIWSLGCLLYYLMFGKLAFQAEAKLQILKGEVSLPPTRPPPLVALLRELLVTNPQQRPTIVTVLRRLQEVADALNVDPTLLVSRSQPPAPGPRQAAPSRGPSLDPPSRTTSLSRESGDFGATHHAPTRTSSGISLQHSQPPQQVQPPLQTATSPLQTATSPQLTHISPPAASGGIGGGVTMAPSSSGVRRSNSFTKAATPRLPSNPVVPLPSQAAEPEGFANFEDAAVFLKPKEDDVLKPPSPPKSQRSLLVRQRESSLSSPDQSNPALTNEVAALRRQVAELQLQNQQLGNTVRTQQTAIKQLQVDNYNQVLQLKRLGLDPVPSVVTKPTQPAAAPTEAGWASFDSPPAEGASGAQFPLAHVRTPRSQSFEHPPNLPRSPTRPRLLNGTTPRPPSPQHQPPPPTVASSGFDPFGIQPSTTAVSEGIASPATDPNSANGTPSETMSRASALSAFAESLKQPALTADPEAEVGSPLSAAASIEGKTHKTSKRSHRRSSSEPPPLENLSLVEEC